MAVKMIRVTSCHWEPHIWERLGSLGPAGPPMRDRPFLLEGRAQPRAAQSLAVPSVACWDKQESCQAALGTSASIQAERPLLPCPSGKFVILGGAAQRPLSTGG